MIRKFGLKDAAFERSPGQNADIFAANLIDQRHGGPITVGYVKYGPEQVLEETIVVIDVMIVLDGQVTVTSAGGTVQAGPSDIVYMPKGAAVSIKAGKEGATTAYVTYPHWQEAEAT